MHHIVVETTLDDQLEHHLLSACSSIGITRQDNIDAVKRNPAHLASHIIVHNASHLFLLHSHIFDARGITAVFSLDDL